jgi:putative transposase
VSVRRGWIEPGAVRQAGGLAVSRQCELAGVSRSWVYAPAAPEVDALDLNLLRLIDAQYTRRPFYGSRRMVVHLRAQGHVVNRKHVQRLMRILGLAGMAPGPATSRAHPEHKVYPYLLRGLAVERPNQVWSTDITYIRLEGGFAYLVAIIDWYSRRVLAWRVSNTLETQFCVDCLEDALRAHGRPGIFNTDQGSQFTSEAFTSVLLGAGIATVKAGRGRALDNRLKERLWRTLYIMLSRIWP